MHRYLKWPEKSVVFLLILTSVGCVAYHARPLDPDEILARVEVTRRTAPDGEVLTLARATELMREHNPRVRDAGAAYAAAQAFADVKTPLPNPTIALGPTFTDFGELLSSEKWGMESALGWTVLLGGKRRLTDDVNAIRAEGAFVGLGAVQREEDDGRRPGGGGCADQQRSGDPQRDAASESEPYHACHARGPQHRGIRPDRRGRSPGGSSGVPVVGSPRRRRDSGAHAGV